MTRHLLLALVLAAPTAFAATPIDQTRPLAPDGRVAIENLKGRIVVRAWDRPEVHIGGTLGDGVERLDVEGGRGALQITVRYPQTGGWFFGSSTGGEPSHLEVRVPAGASVAIDSVSADVDVTGVRGRTLEVDVVSSSVDIRGAAPRELRVDGVSGDVDAEVTTANVVVDSVSGDITLRGRITGRVAVDLVSGDLRIDAGALERLGVGTVSGDVTMRVGLAPGGVVRAESVSGDLRLVLPAATSARLAMESFSGRISSPVGQVVEPSAGPGRHLTTSLGGGDGDIRLEAFSGDATLELR